MIVKKDKMRERKKTMVTALKPMGNSILLTKALCENSEYHNSFLSLLYTLSTCIPPKTQSSNFTVCIQKIYSESIKNGKSASVEVDRQAVRHSSTCALHYF